MFICTHSGSTTEPVIALAHDLTLEHACEIRAELLHLFPAQHICLDLSASERSDLSFLQMMQALIQHADATRTGLSFVVPLPDHIVQLAAMAGASSLMKEISARSKVLA